MTANTDTTAGVTDTVTTRTSADITPFRAEINSGARILMVSSAHYARSDASHPALFSPTVIRGMIPRPLRLHRRRHQRRPRHRYAGGRLVTGVTAVNFINAGGDVVLTVSPSVILATISAVSARATADSVFRSRVQAAVMRVLTVKAHSGLLAPRLPVTGYFGALTRTALQCWLGIAQTGVFYSTTIRALQPGSGPLWSASGCPARRRPLAVR